MPKESLRNNKLLRAVDHVMRGARRLGLPLYSSECSKHSFTQLQLLVLLVVRQMLSRSYRDFASWPELMTVLCQRCTTLGGQRNCSLEEDFYRAFLCQRSYRTSCQEKT